MDLRLARGVDAFNAGRFFAAHEIWEELWLDTVGTEKALLQGLVQIAAGYAKVESGLRGGALKLLAAGTRHIQPFLPEAEGLDLQSLAGAVAADIARLQAAPGAAVNLEVVRPPTLYAAPSS